jgi:ABC-type branched-subunit amino acid transport system substrate-binding protein
MMKLLKNNILLLLLTIVFFTNTIVNGQCNPRTNFTYSLPGIFTEHERVLAVSVNTVNAFLSSKKQICITVVRDGGDIPTKESIFTDILESSQIVHLLPCCFDDAVLMNNLITAGSYGTIGIVAPSDTRDILRDTENFLNVINLQASNTAEVVAMVNYIIENNLFRIACLDSEIIFGKQVNDTLGLIGRRVVHYNFFPSFGGFTQDHINTLVESKPQVVIIAMFFYDFVLFKQEIDSQGLLQDVVWILTSLSGTVGNINKFLGTEQDVKNVFGASSIKPWNPLVTPSNGSVLFNLQKDIETYDPTLLDTYTPTVGDVHFYTGLKYFASILESIPEDLMTREGVLNEIYRHNMLTIDNTIFGPINKDCSSNVIPCCNEAANTVFISSLEANGNGTSEWFESYVFTWPGCSPQDSLVEDPFTFGMAQQLSSLNSTNQFIVDGIIDSFKEQTEANAFNDHAAYILVFDTTPTSFDNETEEELFQQFATELVEFDQVRAILGQTEASKVTYFAENYPDVSVWSFAPDEILRSTSIYGNVINLFPGISDQIYSCFYHLLSTDISLSLPNNNNNNQRKLSFVIIALIQEGDTRGTQESLEKWRERFSNTQISENVEAPDIELVIHHITGNEDPVVEDILTFSPDAFILSFFDEENTLVWINEIQSAFSLPTLYIVGSFSPEKYIPEDTSNENLYYAMVTQPIGDFILYNNDDNDNDIEIPQIMLNYMNFLENGTLSLKKTIWVGEEEEEEEENNKRGGVSVNITSLKASQAGFAGYILGTTIGKIIQSINGIVDSQKILDTVYGLGVLSVDGFTTGTFSQGSCNQGSQQVYLAQWKEEQQEKEEEGVFLSTINVITWSGDCRASLQEDSNKSGDDDQGDELAAIIGSVLGSAFLIVLCFLSCCFFCIIIILVGAIVSITYMYIEASRRYKKGIYHSIEKGPKDLDWTNVLYSNIERSKKFQCDDILSRAEMESIKSRPLEKFASFVRSETNHEYYSKEDISLTKTMSEELYNNIKEIDTTEVFLRSIYSVIKTDSDRLKEMMKYTFDIFTYKPDKVKETQELRFVHTMMNIIFKESNIIKKPRPDLIEIYINNIYREDSLYSRMFSIFTKRNGSLQFMRNALYKPLNIIKIDVKLEKDTKDFYNKFDRSSQEGSSSGGEGGTTMTAYNIGRKRVLLQKNAQTVCGYVDDVLESIFETPFPSSISKYISTVYDTMPDILKDNINVIEFLSNFLFLRLICPSITLPYNIIDKSEHMDDLLHTILKDVSSVIQKIGTNSEFNEGHKLYCCNEYIKKTRVIVMQFLLYLINNSEYFEDIKENEKRKKKKKGKGKKKQNIEYDLYDPTENNHPMLYTKILFDPNKFSEKDYPTTRPPESIYKESCTCLYAMCIDMISQGSKFMYEMKKCVDDFDCWRALYSIYFESLKFQIEADLNEMKKALGELQKERKIEKFKNGPTSKRKRKKNNKAREGSITMDSTMKIELNDGYDHDNDDNFYESNQYLFEKTDDNDNSEYEKIIVTKNQYMSSDSIEIISYDDDDDDDIQDERSIKTESSSTAFLLKEKYNNDNDNNNVKKKRKKEKKIG